MKPQISLVLALVATFGCVQTTTTGPTDAGDTETRCDLPFVGDPNGTPDVELIAMGADNEVTVITEGSPVPLMFPPQGGRVMFVGVRARNVDPCTVELVGAMRDPVSSQVRLDARTVNLRPAEGGGMAESARGVINTWANVPACPNQWADQNIHDQTFALTIAMKERSGREFSRTINVVPFCGEPGTQYECQCECESDYQNGEDCSPDGGSRADANWP